MDKLVKRFHSPEHKILDVEGIEDIIDVENEMGFGEGEEWSHEDRGSSVKRSILESGALKSPGYIRSRSSSPPPRRLAKDYRKWHPQKPSYGLKHAVSSLKDNEKKPSLMHPVQHGEDNAVLSSDNDNADSAQDIATSIMQHMGRGGEDDMKQIKRQHPHDRDRALGVDAEHGDGILHGSKHGLDNEQRNQSPQISKHGSGRGDVSPQKSRQGSADKNNTSNRKGFVHSPNQGTVQRVEPKSGMEKRQERNRNRVRFSLDFETAEKLMGHSGTSKGMDMDEGEKDTDMKEGQMGADEQNAVCQNAKASPAESSAEKGLIVKGKAVSAQKRKEPFIRRDMVFDLEKALEMRDDKKALRLAQERIDRLEDALLRQQEIAANIRIFLAQDGLKDYTKLRQLLDALEKNIRKLAISRSRHFAESYQLKNRADQVERLKAHCNMLETERERLRKNLEHLLESTKEKEREVETLMAERDRLLKCKDTGPENSLENWESKLKKVEESFAAERGIWENNFNACQSDWKDKEQNWAIKLEEKEVELSSFKLSQERLVKSLILCQQSLDELKDVVDARKGDTGGHERVEGLGYCVHGLPQLGLSCRLCSPCHYEEIDTSELACNIHADIQSLKKLLEESPLVLQRELRVPSYAFEEEIRILEDKVSRTLDLTDRCKQEMDSKEDEIRKANESYGQIVAEKVRQVDALEKQLAEKEHGVDAIIQGLKDEVSVLSKELYQERSERLRLSDLQGDMKHELSKGLQEREHKWEDEVEELKGKLDDMAAAVALKDGRIGSLEEEVQAKAEQLAQEKQKWDVAIKEVKQRAARTILRFVSDKENGLLEHVRERRKGRKTSECQTCFTSRTDGDKHGVSAYQEAPSLREKLHSHKQAMSMERHSPGGSQGSNGTGDENINDHKELESHKAMTKQDRELRRNKDKSASAQAYCTEEEFYPKAFKRAGRNRGMDKQDIWDILEREKGSGDNTFTLLQSTVKDLE